MIRKCDKCGHVEKGSPFEWLMIIGLVNGGPTWPMKPCPKCKGFLVPLEKAESEQDKSNLSDK